MRPTLDDEMPGKGRPMVAIRLDPATIAELDYFAEKTSTPIHKSSRTDVMRYAMEVGLAQLRKQYGAPGRSSDKPTKRRGPRA